MDSSAAKRRDDLAGADPSELLKTHLEKTKRNAFQFALAAKVDPSVVSRAIAGDRRPNFDSADAIERESDGDVPVRAWVNFKRKKR